MPMHPNDDRQHGHAIRRRQGGRTSVYHDQLYPKAAVMKRLLASPDAHPYVPDWPYDMSTCGICGMDYGHDVHNDPVGSDGSTGAN
jgi:hypothetical protein